jgi:hypothetical protein
MSTVLLFVESDANAPKEIAVREEIMKTRFLALMTAVAFAAIPAHAETYNLTLTGASPGGLWSRIGGGVDAAVAAAYPGSTITYHTGEPTNGLAFVPSGAGRGHPAPWLSRQGARRAVALAAEPMKVPSSARRYQTSSGGLANISMVAGGKVPMGIATDGELTLAVTGQKPFKTPIKDVRALVRLYTPAARFQLTHLLMNKDFADKHGVKSFADIVNKKVPIRVAINRRGNMDSDISEMVMDLQGATRKASKPGAGR